MAYVEDKVASQTAHRPERPVRDSEKGVRSIKKVVILDEEELSGEVLQKCLKDTLDTIGELGSWPSTARAPPSSPRS